MGDQIKQMQLIEQELNNLANRVTTAEVQLVYLDRRQLEFSARLQALEEVVRSEALETRRAMRQWNLGILGAIVTVLLAALGFILR